MNEETVDIECSCGQTLGLPVDPPGAQYECPTCGGKVFAPRKTKLKVQKGSLAVQSAPSQIVQVVRLDISAITLGEMMRLVWLFLCASIAIGLLLAIPFCILVLVLGRIFWN